MVLIDDTKKIDQPMEIVIGKKFKFEVWEVIIQKMSLNEVAKFRVDKSVCCILDNLFHTLYECRK